MPYHRMWCLLYRLGKKSRRDWLLFKDRLGFSQKAMSNCSVQHLLFSSFIPASFLLLPISLQLLLHFTLFQLLKLFLSQSMGFTFFQFFSSHWGGTEWAGVWYLVVSWHETTVYFELHPPLDWSTEDNSKIHYWSMLFGPKIPGQLRSFIHIQQIFLFCYSLCHSREHPPRKMFVPLVLQRGYFNVVFCVSLTLVLLGSSSWHNPAK